MAAYHHGVVCNARSLYAMCSLPRPWANLSCKPVLCNPNQAQSYYLHVSQSSNTSIASFGGEVGTDQHSNGSQAAISFTDIYVKEPGGHQRYMPHPPTLFGSGGTCI